MSSSPNMRQFRAYWAFEGHVQPLADEYEQRFGRLPVWLQELDLERIVPLLACCIRIGMPLPISDLLQADEVERREREGQSIRRPKPS